jgi:ABC-type molybdate transport system substrate-binding protein
MRAWAAEVAVGVLTTSQETGAAREFARYLSAPNEGLRYFETNGFKVKRTN